MCVRERERVKERDKKCFKKLVSLRSKFSASLLSNSERMTKVEKGVT